MYSENIHKVSINDAFQPYTELLNLAFSTVAAEFNLTKQNCPTNNAFITSEELKTQLTEVKEFYCYFLDAIPVGFIAIEKSMRAENLYYIENVAVHPEYRHKNIGKQLMAFASNRIKDMGGSVISIGIIDSNSRLKEWYKQLGFRETSIKQFAHLTFDVCYLDKII